MRRIHVTLALVVALAANTTAHANLIVNGGFEDPIVVTGRSFEHRNGAELTGWTSFSFYTPGNGDDPGSVQFTSQYAAVSEGNQAVQLEWAGDWISQEFETIVGKTYELSFDLMAFGPDVTLGINVASASALFIGTYGSYQSHSLLFSADAPLTAITFTNLGKIYTYPHIDNVSIKSIPEPSVLALLIIGFMGGFLFSRRKLVGHPVADPGT